MKKWIFGILLLFTGQFAHAQVGPCPPGMSQYPSPNGVLSCGPLRSDYDQSQGHWETQWGAYTDSDDGTTGWSTGQPSEDIAKEAAIENCVSRGGTHCRASATFRNGCAALVNGDNHGYSSLSATRESAIKRAMKSCEKADERNCQLFRVECSPAKWVSN